jgi:hypothetical protein
MAADRSRAAANNLAHALKTPLAVLRNEMENEATPSCHWNRSTP